MPLLRSVSPLRNRAARGLRGVTVKGAAQPAIVHDFNSNAPPLVRRRPRSVNVSTKRRPSIVPDTSIGVRPARGMGRAVLGPFLAVAADTIVVLL